jgi:hypothetical protein
VLESKLYFYSRAQIQTTELKVQGTGDKFLHGIKGKLDVCVQTISRFLSELPHACANSASSLLGADAKQLIYAKWLSYTNQFWKDVHMDLVTKLRDAKSPAFKQVTKFFITTSDLDKDKIDCGEYGMKNIYCYLESHRLVPIVGDVPWMPKDIEKEDSALRPENGSWVDISAAGSTPNELADLLYFYTNSCRRLEDLKDRKFSQSPTRGTRLVLSALVRCARSIAETTELADYLPKNLDGVVVLTNLCKLGGILNDAILEKVSNPRQSSRVAFEKQMQLWEESTTVRKASNCMPSLRLLTDAELANLNVAVGREMKRRKLDGG